MHGFKLGLFYDKGALCFARVREVTAGVMERGVVQKRNGKDLGVGEESITLFGDSALVGDSEKESSSLEREFGSL